MSQNGKGDTPRKVDPKKYADGYGGIRWARDNVMSMMREEAAELYPVDQTAYEVDITLKEPI